MTQSPAAQVFRLPDVGEGLTEAEIVRWLVAEGDSVVVNQPLVEIETAKALVELPSPYDGTVTTLHAAEGVMLDVGEPLITITAEVASGPSAQSASEPPAVAAEEVPLAADDLAGGGRAAQSESSAAAADDISGRADSAGLEWSAAAAAAALERAVETPDQRTAEPGARPASDEPELARRESVLVGYGVDPSVTTRRRHRRPAATPQGTETPEAGPPGEAAKPVRVGGLEVGRTTEARLTGPDAPGSRPPLAKPPVRKLAKQFGIDLTAIDPTGPGGVVSRADVERAASQRSSAHEATAGPATRGAALRGGADRLVPLRGVARTMAEAMVRSAFTAPHVTTWLDVDVTEAADFLARLRRRHPDQRWSPTVLALAALRRAARRFPRLNATVEPSGDLVREYADVRLGMAVATDRGLLVAGVAGESLVDLAASVRDVAERARTGSLGVAELTGTTISLTNVGVFGVDGGTPILPPGQAAILCLGRVVRRPWVVDDRVVPRDVVTLALSFDHRCVDGELAGRALTVIAEYLADPAVALAER